MSSMDMFIISMAIIGVAAFLLYRYNRKMTKRMYEDEDMIASTKTTAQIFVIDKKRARPTPELLGKQVYDQLGRMSRMSKMCMVKAKVGPKIFTLMCDQPVFEALVPKKTYRVEIAGLYIVSIAGARLELKKKKTFKEKVFSVFSSRMRGDNGEKKK